jgi:aspartyl-tRNA(Asn)/glutamyl-tRNA(Gln) amidotransferase subunit B
VVDRTEWETVIGLEVHVQLNTESKIFSGDRNSFGNRPNTDVGAITLAHPGTLPLVSKEVVAMAMKLGIALDCQINRNLIFDRKNYFYPDSPKGYQITQDTTPICLGGSIQVIKEGLASFSVELTKIHLEEDAGKSIHVQGKKYTNVDLNRAGVPLVEIVTEPLIVSSEQAGLCLITLRRLVRYLEISDGNMEQGSLRCDANVSVRRSGQPLGSKVEVKNMNSIRNVRKAIDYEIDRQINSLTKGIPIISETRMYHPETNTTSGMRTKEALNDYRYFPEPDISPIFISDQWYDQVKASLPMLPQEVRNLLITKYGLPSYDSELLSEDHHQAAYFFKTAELCKNYKAISNWMMGIIKSFLKESGIKITQFVITPAQLASLLQAVDDKLLSHSDATQRVFKYMLEDSGIALTEILVNLGLTQQGEEQDVQPLIDAVLNEHAIKVKEYHNGKKGIAGMFMGLVKKRATGGLDTIRLEQMIIESLKKNKQ